MGGWRLSLGVGYTIKCSKPQETKRFGKNKKSHCAEGENRAGESSCVLYIRQFGPNSDHIFGPSSGTLGPITKKIWSIYQSWRGLGPILSFLTSQLWEEFINKPN